MEAKERKAKNKSSKSGLVFIVLAIILIACAGFFTYKFLKNRKVPNKYIGVKAAAKYKDGLKIGDFVNYDAGAWSDLGDSKIALENSNRKEVDKFFKFGKRARTRNEKTTARYNETYESIAIQNGMKQDNYYNPEYKGWRVLDIDKDEITLISGLAPEVFSGWAEIPGGSYAAAYVLTGNNEYLEKLKKEFPDLYNKVKDRLKPRDFSDYKNNLAQSAKVFEYSDLIAWLKKNTNMKNISNVNDVYLKTLPRFKDNERFSVIHNGQFYSLAQPYDSQNLLSYTPFAGAVGSYGMNSYGVRTIVKLKKNILVKKEGTKKVDNTEYTIWNIKEK